MHHLMQRQRQNQKTSQTSLRKICSWRHLFYILDIQNGSEVYKWLGKQSLWIVSWKHADKTRVVVRCKAQGTVPLFIAGQGHAQDDV
jgi:hypothetical protein